MNKGEVNSAGFITVTRGSDSKGHMLTNRYIVNIKSILGAAHLVPEPGSSKKFWVNNFIDLETFNDICCQSGPIPGPGISKLNKRRNKNARRPVRLGEQGYILYTDANVYSSYFIKDGLYDDVSSEAAEFIILRADEYTVRIILSCYLLI